MTFREVVEIRDIKPRGVLHVGAAMLEEAEDYQAMNVLRVIWVEAMPASLARMARALIFEHELYEGIALSDTCGPGILHTTSNECSTSLLPLKRHNDLYPGVKQLEDVATELKRADKLFKRLNGIDTLVVDVQGMELPVLRGMGKLLSKIKWCWLEVNETELYEGCTLKPELDDWMAKAGFGLSEYFPNMPGEWGDCFFCR